MSETTGVDRDFQVPRVFDRIFALLRRQGLRIVAVLVLLVAVPQLLIELLKAVFGWDVPAWPLSLASFVLMVLAQATIMEISLEASQGRQATLKEALAQVLPQLPALFMLAVLLLLGTALGFMLLVFPGFYAVAALSAAMPLMLMGEGGIVKVLRRSPYLTEGLVWPILQAVLPVSLASMGFGYVLYRLVEWFEGGAAMHGLLTEPLGAMVWVAGQGLVLPAVFHEIWWETTPAEPTPVEVFD